MGIVNGKLYGDRPVELVFPVFFAVSIVGAVAVVVVVVLRKQMD